MEQLPKHLANLEKLDNIYGSSGFWYWLKSFDWNEKC
jgi:hypothetical protein